MIVTTNSFDWRLYGFGVYGHCCIFHIMVIYVKVIVYESAFSVYLGRCCISFCKMGCMKLHIKRCYLATSQMLIHKLLRSLMRLLSPSKSERVMRNFLWDGVDGKSHMHLVAWNQVCKPKEMGGLGIGNICSKNKALLGKWWWMGSVERNSLWKRIVKSKYRLQENGWDVGLARYRTFKSPWKFIFRSYLTFLLLVKGVAKGGNIIRFWKDVWCGDSLFRGRFPSLYRLSSLHNKPIRSSISFVDSLSSSPFSWVLHFRRTANDYETAELGVLLGLLDLARIESGGEDFGVWEGDSSAIFSIKSFYDSFFSSPVPSVFPYFRCIWKESIPHKVKVFTWSVALGKLATHDMLQKRWPTCALCPNLCVICWKNSETQDHLLLHCGFFECRLVQSIGRIESRLGDTEIN